MGDEQMLESLVLNSHVRLVVTAHILLLTISIDKSRTLGLSTLRAKNSGRLGAEVANLAKNTRPNVPVPVPKSANSKRGKTYPRFV